MIGWLRSRECTFKTAATGFNTVSVSRIHVIVGFECGIHSPVRFVLATVYLTDTSSKYGHLLSLGRIGAYPLNVLRYVHHTPEHKR